MSWTRSNDDNGSVVMWLAALVCSYILYKTLSVYLETPPTVYNLRGPDASSWLFGNFQLTRMYRNEALAGWIREYGSTFAVHGVFGVRELLLADTKAVAFILSRPSDFPKPRILVNATKNIFGDGLLAAEGFEHKMQRKALSPAFSMAAMRDVSPMLMHVAQELRDQWKAVLSDSSSRSSIRELDVFDWVSKAALDMIGIAGFGYKFDSLHDSSNELARAFHDLSVNLSVITFMGLWTTFFPALRHLDVGTKPTKSNLANKRSMAIMRRIGSQMIKDMKAEAEQLGESSSTQGKDLLSSLIRANMKENAAERLDDEMLLAQISTFLLAGHETTATAVSWGLYALSKDSSVQSKLRDEVLAFPNDSPSMEELNVMPYLNNVVKEILRLLPPIAGARRIAREDSFVPLAQPITDKHGNEVNEIFIRRGGNLVVHIYASNTRSDIWGPDSLEFNPERFDKLPEAVSEITAMFGNLSTFLAGPRGCIGWRMAVLEIKSLLFTLVRTFEFAIDPKIEISGKLVITTKPAVKGQEEKGGQLPLHVSLLQT
ncbi:hypothetical protein FRB97_008868 [Tulasnella sp. 331]|nr:hypothetical protein FRB97_008868 [Tulasnella sp. 331]